jgi:ABC-type Na+ efflux pump permease subunit
MAPMRYLVGESAALAELLERTDRIQEQLTNLDIKMASVEERAALVVRFLDADRTALKAEIELLKGDLATALADDVTDEAEKARLQAELDAAIVERDAAKETLAADVAEETNLEEVILPIEQEITPPTPED